MRALIIPSMFLVLCLFLVGCTGTGTQGKSSYTVNPDGILTLQCAPVTMSEEILFTNETYTKSRIVLHTDGDDVVTYLAAPKKPVAAVVYSPGAGEKLLGHEERMARFASAGYAFIFVDMRGNGGRLPESRSASS